MSGILYLNKKRFTPHIDHPPPKDLNTVIVIPCYNEPNPIDALESLIQCKTPTYNAEVIIVINHPVNASYEVIKHNEQTYTEIQKWIAENESNTPKIHFYTIYKPDLPVKKAGVGLARQIGMDEAFYRLHQINNTKGIIASFDSDATCDSNYLVALENHFREHPGTTGVSIYFEHPLSGHLYPDFVYKKVYQYELYLRYYINALRYTGFPHAFHTLGSSFAVRADIYAKQGGMNQRKAGEDFYFLHKIIPLGNFYELNTTRVVPSPRPSLRVPFGTGAAINKYINSQEEAFLTYSPVAFKAIKDFIDSIDEVFYNYSDAKEKQPEALIRDKAPEVMVTFLESHDFFYAIKKILKQSPRISTFHKRFFQWFTAFRILKFMNFSHPDIYKYEHIETAANQLLQHINNTGINHTDDVLTIYRTIAQTPHHFK